MVHLEQIPCVDVLHYSTRADIVKRVPTNSPTAESITGGLIVYPISKRNHTRKHETKRTKLREKNFRDPRAENIEGEIEDAILSEIESEFADVIEQIQGYHRSDRRGDGPNADILSPYWKKGSTHRSERSDDAWNELIQEHHIFIPTKMLEMISKVIPMGSTNIQKAKINALKILDIQEIQERVVAELSGMTEGYIAIGERGTIEGRTDFESGKLEQDAYDSAMGMLDEEKTTDYSDKFFSMMLPEYQFSIMDNERQVRRVKNETYFNNTLKKQTVKWCNKCIICQYARSVSLKKSGRIWLQTYLFH